MKKSVFQYPDFRAKAYRGNDFNNAQHSKIYYLRRILCKPEKCMQWDKSIFNLGLTGIQGNIIIQKEVRLKKQKSVFSTTDSGISNRRFDIHERG
ncbi:MAG: hypothetical protein K0R05_3218 [Anaerocolumna sp.]|nr:hypothetical protein [Anaerocolumna sp.]